MFKIEGTITQIGQPKKVSDKLTIKTFRIKTKSEYPTDLEFQLKNAKSDLINPVQVNETVIVNFDVNGTVWKDKVITNLNAYRIEKAPLNIVKIDDRAIEQKTMYGNNDDGTILTNGMVKISNAEAKKNTENQSSAAAEFNRFENIDDLPF